MLETLGEQQTNSGQRSCPHRIGHQGPYRQEIAQTTHWRRLPSRQGLGPDCGSLPLNFDGRIVLVEPKIDPSEFLPLIQPPGGLVP
jgi:hypothetical protein